jgi:hypothetical protein
LSDWLWESRSITVHRINPFIHSVSVQVWETREARGLDYASDLLRECERDFMFL